jgi:hypothetical protein
MAGAVKKIMFLVAITWGLGVAAGASAQAPPPQPPDDQEMPPVASSPGFIFKHNYKGNIRGDVTRVSMGNRYSASINMGTHLNWITNLSVDEAHYRLQDRRDTNKNFTSNLVMMVLPGLNLTGTLSDSRVFNRVITFTNATQDFKNDSKQASGDLTYVRILPAGLQFNGGVKTGFTQSEQTFLREQSLDASVRGRMKLNAGRLTVTGSGYLRQTDSEAITSGILNKGLGINADSLKTTARLAVSPALILESEYAEHTFTNEFMDLPRGIFLEQQFTDDLRRELETRTGQQLIIKAITKPLPFLDFSLRNEHSESLNDYVISTLRFRRTVTDHLQGILKYTLSENASANVTLEHREVLNDLGPQNLGSYLDERKSIKFTFASPLLRSMNMTLQAGTSLLQTFFVDFDVNPRDRDQLDRYVNLNLSSNPFPKITANIYLSAQNTDLVNIHNSLSADNRQETTYTFRPDFTYRINDRLNLKQQYGLNIEFTDFTFSEDDNFLDRNFTFTNTLNAQITQNLSSQLYYQLRLHDRGSFLPRESDGVRILDINQEDRRDQLTVGFRYQLSEHLAVVGEHDYSQRRDVFAGGGAAPSFTDGGLELGVEGLYNFGTERKLQFRMIKVERFGRFNSPEQESYWIMDSSLVYAF